MWQVLLAAAAAAGSGILAKRLINPLESEKPISDFDRNLDEFEGDSLQEKRESFCGGGKIFRFSSPENGSKKKPRNGVKGNCNVGSKKGKKKMGAENGKKISVCLKRRKTVKHVAEKCESCASKDNSFSCGVGLGIVYMMSAGNAKISSLSCTMDETIKNVKELKDEISRRKSSLSESESGTNKKYLKEEQQPEVLEMDRLEAEFESELQKLHSCATEGSCSEGRMDIFEVDSSVKEHPSEDFEHSNLYERTGILPCELDGKLRNLLIEQQENQIVGLETELHNAHSKLLEKEAELQALKDCVKRLTEFSLENASDEETEDDVETKGDGIDQTVGFEPTESTVRMKRTLGYAFDDSYLCSKH